ncbi:unnamed protein product [Prunus armeniaca]|uniref:Uncharacterized protein n=1 Tax=Prunus armeniaca TaxID=36596 RepID=A0A6J5TW42_PRUAR|nr:unnamed protein product [Prunus armeniaca]
MGGMWRRTAKPRGEWGSEHRRQRKGDRDTQRDSGVVEITTERTGGKEIGGTGNKDGDKSQRGDAEQAKGGSKKRQERIPVSGALGKRYGPEEEEDGERRDSPGGREQLRKRKVKGGGLPAWAWVCYKLYKDCDPKRAKPIAGALSCRYGGRREWVVQGSGEPRGTGRASRDWSLGYSPGGKCDQMRSPKMEIIVSGRFGKSGEHHIRGRIEFNELVRDGVEGGESMRQTEVAKGTDFWAKGVEEGAKRRRRGGWREMVQEGQRGGRGRGKRGKITLQTEDIQSLLNCDFQCHKNIAELKSGSSRVLKGTEGVVILQTQNAKLGPHPL